MCTDCDNITNHRVLYADDCVCETGYFPVNGSVVCEGCHYSCNTCVGSLDNECVTCVLNRAYNVSTGECPCQVGMYDDNSTCYFCDSNCYECELSSTNCISCFPSQNLINNTCFCIQGYYYDGITCSVCDSLCLECEISPSYCTSCNPSHNTILLSNTCTCNHSLYLNSLTLVC